MAVSSDFALTRVEYDDFLCRPLNKADLADLGRWPQFKKKELAWANFPATTPELRKRWYRNQQKPHIAWLSIRHPEGGDNPLIGRYSFTEPIRSNKLIYGIVIRPDLLDKGFGTITTKIMLQYAFEVNDVDAIWLESKKGNNIAHRVWEKIGFENLGEHFRREVTGRYDLYVGYEFLRKNRDKLPQIDVIK